jgi:thiol:disulfide interchange protein DsbC
MINNNILISVLLVLTSQLVWADTQEASVKKLLQPKVGEGAVIESVAKTPFANIFEVKIGDELIYTDSEAKFIFIGRLIDSQSSRDLTQARLDEMNRIKFSDLPLDVAIKSVKGNGKRVIAVFEDPNCGYCKRFRKTINEMKDITVYTFMYNILSDDSRIKSKNIWCSSDKLKAWDDWMVNGKTPVAAPDSCTSTPHEKVLEVGKKYKVTGTPTIFFTDGSRIPGAIDAKMLEAKLAAIK